MLSFGKCREVLMFTKHLQVMLESGVPIVESFALLVDQTSNKHFKNVLMEVIDSLNNGQTLFESLSSHKKCFGPYYLGMIKMGDKTGTLDKALEYLAEHLDKEYELRKKVQGALLYPAVIVVAMVLLGGYISFIILPMLVDFFASFDADLPITTKILLGFANLMKDHGLLIFIALVASFLSLIGLFQIKIVKKLWHYYSLKMPIFGKILKYQNISQISYSIGILLKSGVAVSESMEITAQSTSNMTFKNMVLQLKTGVEKGFDIGEYMDKLNRNNFIPASAVKMILVGSRTGNLEKSFLYIAKFYDREIDSMTKNITTLIEPIILLVIGFYVGFVALAIISPIYELTGSIR